MKWTIAPTIIMLVCLATMNSLCLGSSDWEYEFQYNLEVLSHNNESYKLTVPIPTSPPGNDERGAHAEEFRNSVDIIYGSCAYYKEKIGSDYFFRISGNRSFALSVNIVTWDSFRPTYIPNDVRSDTTNVSLIIDSKSVRKTDERSTWDFEYYSLIDGHKDYPIPTKDDWKSFLPAEYTFTPFKGWREYPMKVNDTTIK